MKESFTKTGLGLLHKAKAEVFFVELGRPKRGADELVDGQTITIEFPDGAVESRGFPNCGQGTVGFYVIRGSPEAQVNAAAACMQPVALAADPVAQVVLPGDDADDTDMRRMMATEAVTAAIGEIAVPAAAPAAIAAAEPAAIAAAEPAAASAGTGQVDLFLRGLGLSAGKATAATSLDDEEEEKDEDDEGDEEEEEKGEEGDEEEEEKGEDDEVDEGAVSASEGGAADSGEAVEDDQQVSCIHSIFHVYIAVLLCIHVSFHVYIAISCIHSIFHVYTAGFMYTQQLCCVYTSRFMYT